MVRGFYTAASGLWTQEKNLNNIANNISNVSTVGYKKDNLVNGTFGEHMTVRMNSYQQARYEQIGPGAYMQVVDDKYTNYEQGGFEETARPMDMSIMGNGFFVINGEDGEEYLTRDGQFSIDDEGFLVLPGFGRVQGEDGDIEVGTSSINVDRNGYIFVEDEEGEFDDVGHLLIAIPDDYDALEKVNNSLYSATDYTPLTVEEDIENPPVVRQFHLEKSNVNMGDEMTRMLASQRSLQSCSQIVRMYDELSEQSNSQISRV